MADKTFPTGFSSVAFAVGMVLLADTGAANVAAGGAGLGAAAVGVLNSTSALVVPLGATAAPTFFSLTGGISNYGEINVQNTTANASASSDIVATADDGTASTHYVNFGINSSLGGSAPFTGAHAAYYYTSDNELDIAAGIVTGATPQVNIYLGVTPNLVAQFASTGTYFADYTTPTKHLVLSLSGMTASVNLTLASVQSTSQTLTIPNIAGADTIATLGLSNGFTGANVFTSASGVKTLQAATQDAVQILGGAGGTSSYIATITPTTLAASVTFTLPAFTGTLLSATQATASGAQLYTLASGTSTATTTTAAITHSATFSGIFTTGPVSAATNSVTYSGATNTAAVILTSSYSSTTATGSITNATNVSAAHNVLTATPGGAVGAVPFAGEVHQAVVTSAANVFFASGTLLGSYVISTFNTANTTGAAVAAAVVGERISHSVVTTNASGTNTLAAVYGLHISPGTFSSSGGGGLTIATLAALRIDNTTLTTMTATARYAIYSLDTALSSFAGGFVSTSATNGVGYAVGAGAAVVQTGSRTTGVTINTPTGAITLVSAAGSATYASFTVTNSSVAATDTIIVSQKSGTDRYIIRVTAVAASSFTITFATDGGTTTETPVFNYAVVKAVAS